ncbi:glutaredoxin-C4-like isoform X2 [Musa acuminata AAA Group]|uniref:glutaredoxin-C4-like isoform X2 n=1 Tax=Musa acuminata AAA Group TaxID=214697 RepID=UPI0031D04F46
MQTVGGGGATAWNGDGGRARGGGLPPGPLGRFRQQDRLLPRHRHLLQVALLLHGLEEHAMLFLVLGVVLLAILSSGALLVVGHLPMSRKLLSTTSILFVRCCRRAKAVFKESKKAPNVVELDQCEDGSQIQDALSGMVGKHIVPQVFIHGKHLGGSDDTVEASESGRILTLLGIDSR